MKEIKKELKIVLKDLKQLTKKTEKIAAKLEELEEASKTQSTAKKPTAKKPAAKKTATKKAAPKKKVKKKSASETILNIILKNKTPIDTATLKQKTKFKDNNIRMIVYRLKKRGVIKSVRKGVYTKA